MNKPFHLWRKSDFANEEIFQQFAHYLANHAVKKITVQKEAGDLVNNVDADGEALAIGTALQYFSNFLQAVIRMEGASIF